VAKVDLAFQTDYLPDECLTRLAGQIDPEERTLFSTGYSGQKPVVGTISDNQFRLLKRRRYSRNQSRVRLYGIVTACNGGSAVECYWEQVGWFRLADWMLLVLVAAVGVPFFLGSLAQLFHGSTTPASDPFPGLIGPPAVLLLLIVMLKARSFVRVTEQSFLTKFLKEILPAIKVVDPVPGRAWKSDIAK
jgi:hypothetical protein